MNKSLPTFRFWLVEKYVEDASPVMNRSPPMFAFCRVERYVVLALVAKRLFAVSAVDEA